jgi:hypothetical protein
MRESTIERFLRTKVEAMGGRAIKIPAIHHAGIPDRLVLLPMGRVFFAETKCKGGSPSKIQLLTHRKLRGMGFRVEVIDNNQRTIEILEEYA